jgi:hypothetical protein
LFVVNPMRSAFLHIRSDVVGAGPEWAVIGVVITDTD